VLVTDAPEDWMHREARVGCLTNGTYELCGPKIGKNPERLIGYVLIPHGDASFEISDRTYEGIRKSLVGMPIEGLVFWHPDGRRAKIRRKDFGFVWPWPVSTPADVDAAMVKAKEILGK
jgi:hypothetical protein